MDRLLRSHESDVNYFLTYHKYRRIFRDTLLYVLSLTRCRVSYSESLAQSEAFT
jgi:hypothetical protein